MANKLTIIDVSPENLANISLDLIKAVKGVVELKPELTVKQQKAIDEVILHTEKLLTFGSEASHLLTHVNEHSLREAFADAVECMMKREGKNPNERH